MIILHHTAVFVYDVHLQLQDGRIPLLLGPSAHHGSHIPGNHIVPVIRCLGSLQIDPKLTLGIAVLHADLFRPDGRRDGNGEMPRLTFLCFHYKAVALHCLIRLLLHLPFSGGGVRNHNAFSCGPPQHHSHAAAAKHHPQRQRPPSPPVQAALTFHARLPVWEVWVPGTGNNRFSSYRYRFSDSYPPCVRCPAPPVHRM